jgi:uncharacterized protein (DUF1778 family)
MAKSATRTARIELRTTPAEKQILARAAARERLDLTSFVLRRVLPEATDIVNRPDRIALSERDAKRILDLLDNPPEPTPALLKAARSYLKRSA